MRKQTYREPSPISREEAEAAFTSGDPERIAHALVSVAFHDLERALPALDELARDPEVQVGDALDDIEMFVGR